MKNRLFFFIKILISASLLYLIFFKIDLVQLTLSFKQGNLIYLGIAIIIGIVFNLIKFMKWHYLLKIKNSNVSYYDAAKSYMIGNSLGLVTPMRAGELGRALYFPKGERSRIMGLTVADRFSELTVVFLLAIGGSFVLVDKAFGVLVVFLFICSLFVIYSPTAIQNKFQGNAQDGALRKKINKLINAVNILTFKTVSVSLVYSFIAFLLIIIEFYYLVSAFEDIHFMAIYFIAPLITISTVLPISLMGLGVREGLSLFLLSKYGISPATAVSAAFLLFLINNLVMGLIGIFYLSKTDIDFRKSSKLKSASSTIPADMDKIK